MTTEAHGFEPPVRPILKVEDALAGQQILPETRVLAAGLREAIQGEIMVIPNNPVDNDVNRGVIDTVVLPTDDGTFFTIQSKRVGVGEQAAALFSYKLMTVVEPPAVTPVDKSQQVARAFRSFQGQRGALQVSCAAPEDCSVAVLNPGSEESSVAGFRFRPVANDHITNVGLVELIPKSE